MISLRSTSQPNNYIHCAMFPADNNDVDYCLIILSYKNYQALT